MDHILGKGNEQASNSPCFPYLQDLLVVPCVLGGQRPPGRVGGDISFSHGQVLGQWGRII